MPIEIQRPSGVNVGVNNPGVTVYLGNINAGQPANDTTDGSIRLAFTSGDPTAHIALRTNGVWNDTGFRFSSSSVSLGRDLRMGAVGGFIETFNVSEIEDHLKALLPHIQFDILGTTAPAHMPILDKREDFVTFPGPATGEIIATTIGQVFSAIPTRVLHSATHAVGSVGATAQVEVSYYKGTDNTGSLLNRFNLPASAMVANTPVVIVYDSDFGFENAQNIFFEFVSANSISLETNASGDVITTQNGHTIDELDIILDELTLSDEADITFDDEGNFVVGDRF